jgi:CRISPR-associated endonuclease/helicase Cas3
MLDVAAITWQLWDQVFRESRRRDLSKWLGLDLDVTQRWLSFWVGAHDLGKATPGFQGAVEEHRERLRGAGLSFPVVADTNRNHGLLTAHILKDLLSHKLPDQSLASQPALWPLLGRAWADRVARAVGGHHGTFPTAGALVGVTDRDLGDARWAELRARLLTVLVEATGVASVCAPSFTDDLAGARLMLLAGLTSVADWIGSSEEYFPPADPHLDASQYGQGVVAKAENALAHLGWTGWQGRREVGGFRAVFGGFAELRPVQEAAEGLAQRVSGPALIIVEAPTGEGKTEAAFYLSAAWSAQLGQQGCYLALPTQATSDQMYERTKRFLSELYPKEKVNLHLLHSSAALRNLGVSLEPRNISLEGSRDETANVVAEEWFKQAKRGLLAPFAVGTVDQVLLAVLQTRHVFVRLFGLANKTIVVDEVHAYDTYMTALLERLLEWLRSLGCTVVLLSATLPAETRRALLGAFTGPGVSVREAPYPRITWATNGGCGTVPIKVDRSRSRRILLTRTAQDDEGVVRFLGDALHKGGCAACVCNTVDRAQALHQALKARFSEDELTLLHSRFPLARRQDLEGKVAQSFGKEPGARPHRAVVVATQVIEQSLDVDFDLMVSDLAPVDLVIQRAGRLHRHGQARPVGLKEPQLWLRAPECSASEPPDFGASEWVYDRYVLLRTRLALAGRETLDLPEEVEALVEAVYGPEKYHDLSPEWREALRRSKGQLDSQLREERACARYNLVRSPNGPGDILDDFCKELEEDAPDIHRSLQALTRLAEPSVQVVCLHNVRGSLCTDSEGGRVTNLARKPGDGELRALLGQSLSVSHRGLYQALCDQKVPAGWRRVALLRRHRPLAFENGRTTVGKYGLLLDPQLGLVIEKGG